jgi:hypothetical protein
MTYRIVTDPVDVSYVRENYMQCADPDPERPAPAYYDADGAAYVPHDYLEQETDRARFEQRALAEAQALDFDCDPIWIAEAWATYVDGIYGMCLRSATPENIVRKNALMRRIDALLRQPRERDDTWIGALRRSVDELDALERAFTAFDREYFGRPVSRDVYIDEVRREYPEIGQMVPATPV